MSRRWLDALARIVALMTVYFILYTFPRCLTGCLFFSFVFVLVRCSGVSCNISLYILSLQISLRDFLVSGARILNELEILAAFGTFKG
jgi:hypothetical protein